ncbi:MAG: O-antigen ligase family protein, partial [Xanthomonas perforans]|nr:O-antigen ligase family protein [Xanthomonas perforans]
MTNSAAEAIPPASVLTPDAGRWAPLWVILFVALWPTPGLAETVLSLG